MQILKNSSIYLGSSLLNKAIPFLLLPILTKYLDPAEYGILTIFQILINFFTAVVGMAINTNIARNFFNYDKDRLARHIGNILWILCGSTAIISTVTGIITLFYNDLFSIPAPWIRVIPLLSFMFMVNTIYLTILRMESKAYTFGILEVSNTAINMGLTILLLVCYNYGWYSRAIGITGAYFLFFLLSMYFMLKQGYLANDLKKKEVKSILGISIPLIPHALGGIIISMSDRFFIEKMVGIEAVGIYSVGYMFGMVVMLFTDAFIKAWTPWFFKTLTIADIEKKLKIVRFTYLYILLLLALVLVVSLAGKFVLPYLVDSKFHGAVTYIFWIALGYVFFGIYQIFFPYLVHMGRTSFLATSTVIAAILNLILNYVFIDLFGSIGAAYATIISYMVSAGLVFWYQNRYYEMPWLLKG